MSSRYVRNLTRQWLSALSVPFYDTINIEQDPSDPIWATVSFAQQGWEKLSYCEKFLETGSLILTWIGQPGTGDDAVLQAAETDIAVFMQQVDPAGRLELTGREAPVDYAEYGGPEFEISIVVDYTYDPN